jgi:hypothetical protein
MRADFREQARAAACASVRPLWRTAPLRRKPLRDALYEYLRRAGAVVLVPILCTPRLQCGRCPAAAVRAEAFNAVAAGAARMEAALHSPHKSDAAP